MRIAFVAPDPVDFISGGNIYNGQMIKALRQRGASVDVLSSLPQAGNNYDCTILDSIYFNLLKDKTPSRTFALIHHLQSLYPMSADRFESEDRPLLNKTDALIVTSEFMKEFLLRKGYRSTSIIVLQPVAPFLTKTNRSPVTKVNGVMLNNLVERKGVLDFLSELAIARIPPYYTLNIIGSHTADPSYSTACLELVRKDNNLSRTVKFFGTQDRPSVNSIMRKSNLFISASRMETFGMSIQEANLQGIPLLVCEGGYAGRHVSPGQNGWSAESAEKAAQIFENLVTTPNILNSMAESAFEYEAQYPDSWSDTAASLSAFLDDKLNSN